MPHGLAKAAISNTPYFCLLTKTFISVDNEAFTDGELPNLISPFGEIFFWSGNDETMELS